MTSRPVRCASPSRMSSSCRSPSLQPRSCCVSQQQPDRNHSVSGGMSPMSAKHAVR